MECFKSNSKVLAEAVEKGKKRKKFTIKGELQRIGGCEINMNVMLKYMHFVEKIKTNLF